MEKYIGTKIIEAVPMTSKEYNDLLCSKALDASASVSTADYAERDGYLVEYKDGYQSWSPKEAFAEAYKPMHGMSFGLAIEAAKRGHRITRAGWNGKGMFVVCQKGYPDGIPCNENTAKAFGYEVGDLFKCRPYLQMRCADGTHQMWLASQSDILEEDWMVVE